MIYLDTSVLAAYYCPEEKSDAVEKIIVKNKPLMISLLNEVEFASALSRKVREGALPESDAGKILSLFELHISQGVFKSFAVKHEHYHIAKTWIKEFKTSLRTLDALHLAFAYKLSLPIFTTDTALVKSAEHFGIKYITL
jgi:predicted nucleic acid-binding protein